MYCDISLCTVDLCPCRDAAEKNLDFKIISQNVSDYIEILCKYMLEKGVDDLEEDHALR